MDERQLKEILNGEEIPPPDENARIRAMNLALAAYDETQRDEEKKRQGTGLLGRLTGRSDNRSGRRSMKRKYLFGGMATASVALLCVVSYHSLNLYLQQEAADTAAPALIAQQAEQEQEARPETRTALRESDAAEKAQGGAKPKVAGQTESAAAPASPAPKPLADQSIAKQARPAAPRRTEAFRQPADTRAKSELAKERPAPPPSASVQADPRGRIMGAPVGAASGLLGGQPAAEYAAREAKKQHRPDRSDVVQPGYESIGRDRFQTVEENPIKRVADAPVSTFSIDVDTASYSFVRRMLNRGVLPQKNAVRIEELINYFDYDYPLPETRETPFHATATVTPSPWKKGNKLIHIGIKGYDIEPAEKPRSNLVFLLDVSGSMNAPDKLPLMVNSMKLLLDTLKADDTVAIVVYAGAAGTALEPTKVSEKHKILAALDKLRAGGSTAGAAGIRQAYALAESNLDEKAVNRVILATDGDFNVGIANREELKGFVERKRKSGVFLSVLGFGQGNLNDHLMQALAQNGNGVAAHIDTLNEARKVLVEEASSTLFPIAKDVKIQVEFNPAKVAEYRLIGYETRALKREDFRNDKVDAGDIGAGHTVTAIYEITPVDGGEKMIGESRYQTPAAAAKKDGASFSDEYAFLRIRHKLPNADRSTLTTKPITTADEIDDDSSSTRLREARWATAVAAFGQILKGGKHTGDFSYDDVIALARQAKGEDEFGYRVEFLNLVRLAKAASGQARR